MTLAELKRHLAEEKRQAEAATVAVKTAATEEIASLQGKLAESEASAKVSLLFCCSPGWQRLSIMPAPPLHTLQHSIGLTSACCCCCCYCCLPPA